LWPANTVPGADLGTFQHGTGLDVDVIGQPAIPDGDLCFDNAAAADTCRTAEKHPRVNHGIGSDLDPRLDIGLVGIDKSDPGAHEFFVDAPPHDGRSFCQLHAVVDPHGFVGILQKNGSDPPPGGAGRGQHVGQVIFTLGIIAPNPGQGLEYKRSLKDINTGIYFPYPSLFVGGIFFLDDAQDLIAFPQHPAVAEGIIQFGGQHRNRRAPFFMFGDQTFEGFVPQQRNVPAKQQQSASKIPQGLAGTQQSMAGSELLDLQGKAHFVIGHSGSNGLRAMTDHQYRRPAAEGLGALYRKGHHRKPRNRVYHFGLLRFHAGSFAGGQDDRSQSVMLHCEPPGQKSRHYPANMPMSQGQRGETATNRAILSGRRNFFAFLRVYK
jgi:hypothetical protein